MSVRAAEVATGQPSYDAAPVPPGGVPDLQLLVFPRPAPTERVAAFVDGVALRARQAPVGVRRAVAGVVAAALAVAGLVSLRPDPAPSLPATPAALALEPGIGHTAAAQGPLVDVYANPGAGTPITTLANPTPLGAPLVFAVTAEWNDWLRVMLPTAPAGSTGWVQAPAVRVTEHRMRLTVDVVAREVVLRDGGEVAFRAPLAVGTHDSPPPGSTFVSEVLTLSNPETAYGSHALALAGFSNSPDELFRGRGLVAVHGTPDDSVITAGRTPGSVALAGSDVERLASLVTPGTPVDVVGELVRGDPAGRAVRPSP